MSQWTVHVTDLLVSGLSTWLTKVSWAYTPPSGSNVCRSWCDHRPPPTLFTVFRVELLCLSAVGSRLSRAVPGGWSSAVAVSFNLADERPHEHMRSWLLLVLLYRGWWYPCTWIELLLCLYEVSCCSFRNWLK